MKIILLSILALGFSFQAIAHPKLDLAVPAANGHVAVLPQYVELKFSEDLELAMSKVTVTEVGTKNVVSEKIQFKGKEKNILLAELKNTMGRSGIYEVVWKVVSEDSHVMKGKYSFTIDPEKK